MADEPFDWQKTIADLTAWLKSTKTVKKGWVKDEPEDWLTERTRRLERAQETAQKGGLGEGFLPEVGEGTQPEQQDRTSWVAQKEDSWWLKRIADPAFRNVVMPAMQPLGELGQVAGTVMEKTGPLVAGAFDPELRKSIQKQDVPGVGTPEADDPRLSYLYDSKAQEEFGQLPGWAQFAAKETVLLPLYLAGGLGANQVRKNLMEAVMEKYAAIQKTGLTGKPASLLAQKILGPAMQNPVARSQLLARLPQGDKKILEVVARVTQNGKLPITPRMETQILTELYGSARITTATLAPAELATLAGQRLQGVALEKIPQIVSKELGRLGWTIDDISKMNQPEVLALSRSTKTSADEIKGIKELLSYADIQIIRKGELGYEVVKKRGIAGGGMYDPATETIYVADKMSNNVSFHELGHKVWYEYLSKGERELFATELKAYPPVMAQLSIGKRTKDAEEFLKAYTGSIPKDKAQLAEGEVFGDIFRRIAIGRAPAEFPHTTQILRELLEDISKKGTEATKAATSLNREAGLGSGTMGKNFSRGALDHRAKRIQDVQDILDNYAGARWAKPPQGIVGSAQGLLRLPNEARAELYNALTPLVGVERAVIMRDWRPTKISLWLKGLAKSGGKVPEPVTSEQVLTAFIAERNAMTVAKLVKAIKTEVKPFRKEAEELYAQAEKQKAAKFYTLRAKYLEQAQQGKMTYEQAYARADKAFYGEMKPPKWTIGQTLSSEERNVLVEMISDRQFRPFDDKRARDALGKLLDMNQIPEPAELALLERVFGLEFAKTALRQMPFSEKLFRTIFDALNLPRSVLASFDLSAMLRQGAVLLPGHPKEVMAAFKWQMKALRSNKNALEMNELLFGRARGMDGAAVAQAERRLGAGLFMHDLSGISLGLAAREEAFISKFAHKIPIMGKGIEISERTYVTYLNKLRADTFDSIVAGWQTSGKQVTSRMETDLAKYLNRATGRGELWFGEYSRKGAKLMPTPYGGAANLLFFSPRLQTSRVLLPFCMVSGSPAVKRQARIDLLKFGATASTIIGLLSMHPDVNVELDPRSTDFGRIRVNNTRIDILAGMQPFIRLFAQTVPGFGGQRKTAGGRLIPLNRYLNMLHFGRGKLNPVIGEIVDQMYGKDFIGEEVWSLGDPYQKALEEFRDSFMPMYPQSVLETTEQEGLVKGILLSSPEFWGATVSSYDSSMHIVAEVRGLYDVARRSREKYDELIEKGESQKADAYAKSHPEMHMTTFLGRSQTQLNNWENKIKEWEDDDTIPKEDKERMIEEMERTIITYATDVLLAVDGLPNSSDVNEQSGVPGGIPQMPNRVTK